MKNKWQTDVGELRASNEMNFCLVSFLIFLVSKGVRMMVNGPPFAFCTTVKSKNVLCGSFVWGIQRNSVRNYPALFSYVDYVVSLSSVDLRILVCSNHRSWIMKRHHHFKVNSHSHLHQDYQKLCRFLHPSTSLTFHIFAFRLQKA
jgi:hypothetical protein